MPRVLIIDDDPSIRSLVGSLLQTKGVETLEARHGEEALEQARRTPPDLFLCDLDMPIMDGIETLAEIRRDPLLRYIPFVLVTGMATKAQEEQMMRGGANGVLRKPFSFDALLEILQAHLGLSEGDAERGPSCRA
jgi:CheY-like chemotaxis protein